MFTFVIFGFVLFPQTLLIRCSENSTGLEVKSLRPKTYLSPPTVIWFSVPAGHHLCMLCGSADSSDVVWTRQDKRVLVTRQGNSETNQDHRRFLLLQDGSLCLLRLDESNSGEYRCNQELVAELQVLKGRDFTVSVGRMLLLTCSGSSKPKQRWFHRREGRRWEAILTRFRNGTVKAEREERRFSFENDALQILDLQPGDAGEYLCNGELQARVTVLSVHPQPTRICSSTSASASPAAMTTDYVVKKKNDKNRPESALLLVTVVGLGMMILLMAAVCVLLTSMRCRRKKKHRRTDAQTHKDTELQHWKASISQTDCEVFESPPPEETVHYASLGRQNWRERPSRTPPDSNDHSVIYSSVITRPAGDSKQRLTPAAGGLKADT